MKRRMLLKLGLVSTVEVALISGGALYLENEPMKRPPEKPGKIFLDLHAHPSKKNRKEDILKMLSWGITALTTNGYHNRILTYEKAITLPGVTEIDKGDFARIEYKGSTGYFLRAQELMSNHHILEIGLPQGRYLRLYNDSMKVAEIIKKEKCFMLLPHPYFIKRKDEFLGWGIVKGLEEKKIKELAEMADEVESFNASFINLMPIVAWFSEINDLNKKLAVKTGHKGFAASDAHRELEQVKVAGVYIPNDNLCLESIIHHIRTGNFENHERHISRASFIKGFWFSRLYS